MSSALPFPGRTAGQRRAVGWIVAFAVLVVVLFAWAKWVPYWHKIPAVADSGSMGKPVIGDDGVPWFSAAHGWSFTTAYLTSVWPAIVAGLLTAAAVQALLPRDLLVRFLDGGGPARTSGVTRAALAGLPTMLCTCCAAPVAVSLRRSNISLRSTLSFWLANPLLNPAVLAFAFFALSPGWMLLRLGLGAAVLVSILALTWRIRDAVTVPTVTVEPDAGAPVPQGARAFLRALARYTLTLVPVLAGLVFALGAFQGALFPLGQSVQSWGVAAALLLAMAGTLIAVPTGAEIAVVAALLAAGMPAWLAAALLITLPATSIPSLAMVWRSIPHRAEAVIVGVVIVGGLVGSAIAGVLPAF